MNKKYILDEIKRTAAANGGVALGAAAFSKETGISRNDWFGIHWALWGDAVREAGLTPKEFVTAFSPDDTLKPLVVLIRELGKIPNEGELRIRKRADPTFPNSKVFTNKFGARPKLIASILDFCERHSGWDDVTEICRAFKPQRNEFSAEESLGAGKVGYVYLMQHGSRREYKIGMTINPIRREGEIRLELPDKVHPVHYIETDDPSGIEAYWHARFAGRRKQGEWFELTTEEVKAFKRWKKIN